MTTHGLASTRTLPGILFAAFYAVSLCAVGFVFTSFAAQADPAENPIVLAQADDGSGTQAPEAGAAPSDEPAEETGTAESSSGEFDSSSGPPPGVEVMRVRGRGISAVKTEVPSSVTSFDAAAIEALGAQDVTDLAKVTPNVNIVSPGATQANFFVRGIGLSDLSANSQGAVTILQDDVSLNAPAIQTGQLFDIRTVDVLRGPQGIGPNRNASAGAIRVYSNLPTGGYGAQLRATVGRYAADGGKGAAHGVIQDYEGYLEAPIIEETLSSRFAFRLRDSGPYMTNGCGNAPPFSARAVRPQGNLSNQELDAFSVCGERNPETLPRNSTSLIPVGLDDEVNYQDNWAARGTLRLTPEVNDLDLVLNAHGSRLDQDQDFGQAIGTSRVPFTNTGVAGGQRIFGGTTGLGQTNGYFEPDQRQEFEAICGFGPGSACPQGGLAAYERRLAQTNPLDERPYRGDFNKDTRVKRDSWGGFLRGETTLGDTEVFFLGSYDQYERFRDQDTDLIPDSLFEQQDEDEAWQTYEELRISGELATTPFEWEVGGYYLEEHLDYESTTPLIQFQRIDREYSQDTTSFGMWGQFEWDFLDDLTLEGGVRYNWEHKDFSLQRTLVRANIGTPLASEQDETWQTPTGTLILRYFVNPEVQVFAKYGRGFKAGHFNATAGQNVSDPPAKEEKNDAWEAGLSGRWFDRRLSGSVNFFYYRYENYQVFLFRDVPLEPPVLEIVNAAEAENYGIEIEGRVEPLVGWVPRAVEGLTLTGNFGWLHGEFLDFQLISSQIAGVAVIPFVLDFSGDKLQNAPDFTVSGSAAWRFDLGRFGSLTPRYDFSWTDEVFFGVNEGRGSADAFGNPLLPELAVGQDAYWLHNVRLAYRSPTATIEVAAWVRNLEDQAYKQFAFDASRFSNVVLNFVGEPRTIGLDVTITF